LDDWYNYERAAVRTALCEWACEEGFEIEVVEHSNHVLTNEHRESGC
jgi:hypothetical protein